MEQTEKKNELRGRAAVRRARTLTVPNAFYLCKLEKRFTLQVVV